MNPDDARLMVDFAQMKRDIVESILNCHAVVKMMKGEPIEDEEEPEVRKISPVVEGYLRDKGVDCD